MKKVIFLAVLVLVGLSVSPLLTRGLVHDGGVETAATPTPAGTATPVWIDLRGVPVRVIVIPIPSFTPEKVNRDGIPVRLMFPQSDEPCYYYVARKGTATRGNGTKAKPLNEAAFNRRKGFVPRKRTCHTDEKQWPVNQR